MSQVSDDLIIPVSTGTPVSQPPTQSAAVPIDDSMAVPSYSNFCRVTGTPEEVILDFGLGPQTLGLAQGPIRVSQRIIANFFTVKRLVRALQLTLERHESVFGVVETDVERRAHPVVTGHFSG